MLYLRLGMGNMVTAALSYYYYDVLLHLFASCLVKSEVKMQSYNCFRLSLRGITFIGFSHPK